MATFIHDWTLKGGAFRVLSVVEEYTREAHALHVDRHIGSGKVIEVHGGVGLLSRGPGLATGRSLWLGEREIKTL